MATDLNSVPSPYDTFDKSLFQNRKSIATEELIPFLNKYEQHLLKKEKIQTLRVVRGWDESVFRRFLYFKTAMEYYPTRPTVIEIPRTIIVNGQEIENSAHDAGNSFVYAGQNVKIKIKKQKKSGEFEIEMFPVRRMGYTEYWGWDADKAELRKFQWLFVEYEGSNRREHITPNTIRNLYLNGKPHPDFQ